MPSYAKLLLFCAGFAAAAPTGGHSHSAKPWYPWHHSHSTSSSSSPSTTASTQPVETSVSADPTVASSASSASSIPYTSDTPTAPAETSSVVVVTPTSTIVDATSATATSASSSTDTSGLWQPAAGSSWQIILSSTLDASGTLSPDVDVFDIDMFGNSATTMQQLHDKGKKVICYFSAGSYEPYRDDSDQFLASDLGSVMDGWPDEKWIDIRSTNVRNIMTKRIQLAKQRGCDAIDPDNIDGYSNSNGLSLTEDDAHDYMQFLTKTAADNGLSTGLKNANALVNRVVDIVHFSVNEQCHEYNECGDFQPFIASSKPVFNIEYPSDAPSVTASVRLDVCSVSSSGDASGFSTIIKTMDLDGWVTLCDASTATTATAGKR